jgi:hypothetical protein
MSKLEFSTKFTVTIIGKDTLTYFCEYIEDIYFYLVILLDFYYHAIWPQIEVFIYFGIIIF